MIKIKRQHAFTLLEILVAMLIMAIIAVILVAGLRSVINTKNRIEQVSQRLTSMQLAMSIISNDIRQIVNRPIFNNNGQPLDAIILYSGLTQRLEFTRLGYINPLGLQQRSTLQRVSYRFVNNELQRGTWQVLDRVANSKPSYQPLLKNVTHIQWRFLAANMRIYQSWPVPNLSATSPMPKAIEISITIQNWGTLHRWITLNGYHRIIGESPDA
jgi:general secretion pathway protein J